MSKANTNQSDFHKDMNRIMVQLVPELESKFAATPMAYNRWKEIDETMDNGDPCFILSEENNGPRQDYIYMKKRKDLRAGYYHLLTQEAYVEVYYRLLRQAPPILPCCGNSGTRNVCTRKEFKKVKTIIYNRVIAKEPNDITAARFAHLSTVSVNGRNAAFGKAMYLPTLTTTLLLSTFTY